MNPEVVFVNRRKGRDRRLDSDPCKNMPLDLYHRKRRKSTERRATERSLSDDYFAYRASKNTHTDASQTEKIN